METKGSELKREKEMYFQEPDNFEDAFDVITGVSLYLDFWIGRKEGWHFAQLLSKTLDENLWKIVSKCVKTASGLSLYGVRFEELGTQGVLEALCVFSEGILELEIPDIYLKFCKGVDLQSTLSLIKNAEVLKKELETVCEPEQILTRLTAKILSGSL